MAARDPDVPHGRCAGHSRGVGDPIDDCQSHHSRQEIIESSLGNYSGRIKWGAKAPDLPHLAALPERRRRQIGACQSFEFVGLFVQLVRLAGSCDQIALEAQPRILSGFESEQYYKETAVSARRYAPCFRGSA